MNPQAIDWLASHLLPFEAELRQSLRRVCASPAEIDDIVQDVYCKVISLSSLDHIRDPKGYLIRTARNLVTDRMRREAIVRIEAMANLEDLDTPDESPSPEQVALARAELKWIMGLIASLPARCKSVVIARRIEGLSQRETAAALGLTEGLVEKEMARAMQLISVRIADVAMNRAMPGGHPGRRQPRLGISHR